MLKFCFFHTGYHTIKPYFFYAYYLGNYLNTSTHDHIIYVIFIELPRRVRNVKKLPRRVRNVKKLPRRVRQSS